MVSLCVFRAASKIQVGFDEIIPVKRLTGAAGMTLRMLLTVDLNKT
jgi:hypothetical protein